MWRGDSSLGSDGRSGARCGGGEDELVLLHLEVVGARREAGHLGGCRPGEFRHEGGVTRNDHARREGGGGRGRGGGGRGDDRSVERPDLAVQVLMDLGQAPGRSPFRSQLAPPVAGEGSGGGVHDVDPPDPDGLALHRLRAGAGHVDRPPVGVDPLDPRPRGGRGGGGGVTTVAVPCQPDQGADQGQEDGQQEEGAEPPPRRGAAPLFVLPVGVVVNGGHDLILSYGARRLPGALAVGGALEHSVPWPPWFCARVSLPVFDRENPAQKPIGCLKEQQAFIA